MREQTPHGLNPILGKVWTHHNGVLPDGSVCRIADAQSVIDALFARCTALEQELDQAADEVRVRGELISELQTRCQHLEQAVKDLGDAGEMLCVVLANVSGGMWRLQTQDWQNAAAKWRDHYYATIASLLPPQEETQTDENRVSFAAGYTAALDDALKGTT